MMYADYVKTISDRVRARLDEIAIHRNFEHGAEFEIAICKILRAFLPTRFGICRGYLIASTGQREGDDIIIYDHAGFPTLRLLGNSDFARKESIPIEAAYAYIEAKHSLVVEGSDQTFEKAIQQVSNAKALVATREEVTLATALDRHMTIADIRELPGSRTHWPKILNPFFAGVIARNVRKSKGSSPLEASEIRRLLMDRYLKVPHPPDLIVSGEDIVGLPVVREDRVYHSPFAIPPQSDIALFEKSGSAFAIGLCSLLYALDTIRLGKMPWPHIIGDTLGLKIKGHR